MATQLKGWVTQTSLTTISVTSVSRLIPRELTDLKKRLVTYMAEDTMRRGLRSLGRGWPNRHPVDVHSRFSVAAVAALLLVAGCGSDSATIRGIVRDEPLQVGTETLTDVTSEGEFATHDELFVMKAQTGQLLVMYFGYTNCPDLCPTTLAAARTAIKNLGADGLKIDLAMATVDLERDTAEVLNGYLSSFSDRFHALHASSQEELEVAENAFLASSTVTRDANGKIEVGHSATAYVIDDQGTILVEWPFGIDSDAMTNDLQILLRQISQK